MPRGGGRGGGGRHQHAIDNSLEKFVTQDLPDEGNNIFLNTDAETLYVTVDLAPGSWLGIGFGTSIDDWSDEDPNVDFLRFAGQECDCDGGPWFAFVEDYHRVEWTDALHETAEDWEVVETYFALDSEEDDRGGPENGDILPVQEDFRDPGIDGGYHTLTITA